MPISVWKESTLPPVGASGTPINDNWYGFWHACNFGCPKAWSTLQIISEVTPQDWITKIRSLSHFSLWSDFCFGKRLPNNHTYNLYNHHLESVSFQLPPSSEKSHPFFAASPAVVIRFGPPAHPKSSRAAAHPRFQVAWPEFFIRNPMW